MNCSSIIKKLEKMSPLSFAEEWDNSGLLCGRQDKEVRRVCLAVDATDQVVEEAVRLGADLLLTHHPLIFKPIKRILAEDVTGRRIFTLIRHDICYYAMHTNFDIMRMADAAADELGLLDRQILDVTYEDGLIREGIGRAGRLPGSMTLGECADYVREVFDLARVRVFGDDGQRVEYAAISPGSGSSVLQSAVKARMDVLITGDIDHHEGLDGLAQGLSLIDAGHFGLEKIFVTCLEEFFRQEMPGIELCAVKEEAPFHFK